MGASRRSRWAEFTSGSVINRIIRNSGAIDVHIISTQADRDRARSCPSPTEATRPRWLPGAVGWGGRWRCWSRRSSPQPSCRSATTFTCPPCCCCSSSSSSGWRRSAVPDPRSSRRSRLRSTPTGSSSRRSTRGPSATRTTSSRCVVFVSVALIVSWFVATVARRSAEAARARAEAETLARLAGATTSADPLATVVEHLVDASSLKGASVLAQQGDRLERRSRRRCRPPDRPCEGGRDDRHRDRRGALSARRARRRGPAGRARLREPARRRRPRSALRREADDRGRAVEGERASVGASRRGLARPAHARSRRSRRR